MDQPCLEGHDRAIPRVRGLLEEILPSSPKIRVVEEAEQGAGRPVWKLRVGLGLVLLACLGWALLLVVPFLPMSVAGRAWLAGGLLVAAEAAFLVGSVLAGAEAIQRWKDRLRRRRQEAGAGPPQ